jgi:hypothetical protein
MELNQKLSSPPSEPEKTEAGSIDLSRIDLYELVDLFIMLLSEQALRYLGLRVDPRTNETKTDAAKAHLAIDCIISLVDKMEPNLPSEAKDRLRNLITELQLKYVQQIK